MSNVHHKVSLNICNIGAVARGFAFHGEGVGLIHLDDLMCTGFEQTLFDCTSDPTHNCVHKEDAGVVCLPIREHVHDIVLLVYCLFSYMYENML